MTTGNGTLKANLAQEMLADLQHPRWDEIVAGYGQEDELLREILLRRIPSPIAEQLRDPHIRDADVIGDLEYAYEAEGVPDGDLSIRQVSDLEVAYVNCYLDGE